MFLSRDRSKTGKAVTFLAEARQWTMCLVCLVCGIALIVASRSHHAYRSLELFVGIVLLTAAFGDLALGILLAVAARDVKPRKLETE